MRDVSTALSQSLATGLLLAGVLLSACNPYDIGAIHRPDKNGPNTDAGPDGSKPNPDGGDTDGGPCGGRAELCNNKDDDCDGVVDEMANLDCEDRLVHGSSTCSSGACVPMGCDMGYYNCDGDPSNGCEPWCDCHVCDDAGADDGGADDGG